MSDNCSTCCRRERRRRCGDTSIALMCTVALLWLHVSNDVSSAAAFAPGRRLSGCRPTSSAESASAKSAATVLHSSSDATDDRHVPWPNRRPSPSGGDMAYVKDNIERQALNYGKIRDAGGVECINDLYVRNPQLTSFWYVGKVARCTGIVSVEEAAARQLNLIEEHATRLRPIELGRTLGMCEVWAAPGNTEMRVSENDPNVKLEKLDRYVDGCEDVNSNEVGLALEVVTNQGVGFFAERDENGCVPPHLIQ